MALILFITIDFVGGCSNTGHNPYLELQHLIFVVLEHVFLGTPHENRGENPLLTVCLGTGLQQEE